MSNQGMTGGVNPFEVAQRWMTNRYAEGVRQQQSIHQAQMLHDTLAVHAATHASVMKQATHTARLEEKASKGKSQRATEFLTAVHGMSEPGTSVQINHGDISASFTKTKPVAATPAPTAAPAATEAPEIGRAHV